MVHLSIDYLFIGLFQKYISILDILRGIVSSENLPYLGKYIDQVYIYIYGVHPPLWHDLVTLHLSILFIDRLLECIFSNSSHDSIDNRKHSVSANLIKEGRTMFLNIKYQRWTGRWPCVWWFKGRNG